MTKAFQIMHNMMVAHALAVLEYKKAGYNGKIGVVQSLEYKYPFDENNLDDIQAAKMKMYFKINSCWMQHLKDIIQQKQWKL